MDDACPICAQPGPRHITNLHLVWQERHGPPCGCNPPEHDQAGPCVRRAGHTGICYVRMLALCPACGHGWEGHERGEPDLTIPGAGRDPRAPRPWKCAAVDCPCGAWWPHDEPPHIPAGTLLAMACRDDDSVPHPVVAG